MSDSDMAQEFTRYYEEHKTAIFNYILYRISFNRDTAEALTSEIFLKAFEAFERYDRARPFKTWIFTIAHNHLVNYYAGRKDTLPLEEAVEVVKGTPIPEDIDQKMTMGKILHLISKLPAEKREILIMRYVNDLSNSEIAAITDKEEGAVRTALSRAVSALRNAYQVELSQSPEK
jgi:RNA polymerase sigma-70 factor (ECF subfamily)